MADSNTGKQSIKKWIWLLVSPLIALAVYAALMLLIADITPRDDLTNEMSLPAVILTYAFAIYIGTYFVVCPLFIVMLTRTIYINNGTETKKLSKTAAIIFAAVFGLWAWIYTYEVDKKKFWWNFGLYVVTLSFWGLVAWIWTIYDAVRRPDEFYNLYPDYQPETKAA